MDTKEDTCGDVVTGTEYRTAEAIRNPGRLIPTLTRTAAWGASVLVVTPAARRQRKLNGSETIILCNIKHKLSQLSNFEFLDGSWSISCVEKGLQDRRPKTSRLERERERGPPSATNAQRHKSMTSHYVMHNISQQS
jgi:hypothetical protein